VQKPPEQTTLDKVMAEFGYSEPYPASLYRWIEVVEAAISAERERCALIAEDAEDSPPYDPGAMRDMIAQRIRGCTDDE
jgi:hypothetical protein